MALDPRIALGGIQPQFSLFDLGATLRTGQQLQAGQLALTEEQRQQQAAAATREAFRQQYGGGAASAGAPGSAPAGLAGVAPVQERQMGGAPSAAFPGGPAQPLPYTQGATPVDPRQAIGPGVALPTPPPGPEAMTPLRSPTQGLAGQAPAGQQGQNRAFINKLYTIDPKAAMAYENHLTTTTKAQADAQEAQMKANVSRVEFLGRVADGVLESENPQQAWEVARAMLREQGMPESQLPAVYDPSYVRQLSGMARDAKDKYNEGMLRLQQGKEQRERTEAGAKAPNYGLGDKLNAAVFATSGPEIAPGQSPTPAQVQKGRQRLIDEERAADEAKQQGRVDVAAATGEKAAQARTVSETAQKRLAALDAAGLAAQDTHTSLDEIDRLLGEGVYGNSPVDRAAMLAYRKGVRPNDTKAQRTTRLRELGNQLILARGSLGGNVSKSDAEVYARAAGNFEQAKNVQEMRESIKSMRTILNKAVDYANKGRETYEATGKLPPFEGRPAAGPPKPLPSTVEDLDREIADIERQLQGQ